VTNSTVNRAAAKTLTSDNAPPVAPVEPIVRHFTIELMGLAVEAKPHSDPWIGWFF
jgi:hypothetical protein